MDQCSTQLSNRMFESPHRVPGAKLVPAEALPRQMAHGNVTLRADEGAASSGPRRAPMPLKPLQPGPHLASGLYAADDTHVQDAPGTGQAEQDPPLHGARVADGVRDVEGLPVPEVIHWCAEGALLNVACGGCSHMSVWVTENGDQGGDRGHSCRK